MTPTDDLNEAVEPLTADEMAHLRELLGKATPGPWFYRKRGSKIRLCGPDQLTVAQCPVGHMTKHHQDAALIVALVNAAPRLLAMAKDAAQ